HPDTARSGAVDTAHAVDLQAVGYAGLPALVHVGKDAAADHMAGGVEGDGMDVLRRARVCYIHRPLVERESEPVGVFAIGQHAQGAVGRQAIDARAVPPLVFAGRAGNLALPIGATLVGVGEVQAAVGMANHVIGSIESAAPIVVGQRLHPAVRAHAREATAIALAND